MITIFTSPICGRCRTLKRMLDERGIPFEESTDYSQMKDIMSLPALKFEDGTLVTFDTALQWLNNIKEKN